MVAGPRTKTPKSNPGEWSCDPFPVQQFTAINEHLTSHFQKLSLLNGPKKWDIAEKKMRGRKKKRKISGGQFVAPLFPPGLLLKHSA